MDEQPVDEQPVGQPADDDDQSSALSAVGSKLELLTEANEASGKAITFLPQHGCLPALTGRDGQLIPLYAFIEVLDELADYDAIQTAFPTLSFRQISGALAFL